MERQDAKGRSRASSTSSLGREVRCGCQYFQSDSLLPERSAMISSMRPSSRNTNQSVTTSSAGDHEYEPVGTITLIPRTMAPSITIAPVVRIIDTDVVPVADSDDSIDVKGRFTPGPVLDDDDVILPLDGQIEDRAMEARELVSGDTSDDLELETAQELQDRLEERFLQTATPATESRTDGEVNTSQVDSSAMEELPLRRGVRGLPQRLRSQAGKLRSRLKGIQRPNFTFPIERIKSSKARTSDRSKSSDKTKSSSKSKVSERSHNTESHRDKPSRMERIRSSLPERPKFSFPEKAKLRLPDKSKFHLPERPKINLPSLPKLSSRSSFHLPNLPGRRRAPSMGEQQRQHSHESTAGSRKNIFNFSTVPRLFDRKSKEHGEYTTSSPKESRAQLSESATLPRAKKSKTSFGSQWTARFTDIKFGSDEEMEKPWKHSTSERPRPSLRGQESVEESETIPWIEEHRVSIQAEQLPYDDKEKADLEIEEVTVPKLSKIIHHDSEESSEPEPPQIDPRLYGDQHVSRMDDEEPLPYRVSFEPVDPRKLHKKKVRTSEERDSENEDEINDEEEDENEHYSSEPEDESLHSDREQQASSGSSCDRRRRGVIEEIDSDEFFLRAKGISQDDMTVGKYLTSEIRDALRTPANVLAHEVVIVDPELMEPPKRPARKRDISKTKEKSTESLEAIPPSRPKRISKESDESDYDSNILDNEDSISSSRLRIVYHAESAPLDLSHVEPLDEIIVVKPIRRKSRASLRSSSLVPSIPEISPEVSPPSVPQRRKRRIHQIKNKMNGIEDYNNERNALMETWHMPEWTRRNSEPPVKPARIPSRETIQIITKIEDDYIEPQAESEIIPIPPRRRSRSRGTSILQDDDRISRGGESMSDIAYADDDEQDDNEPFTQDDYNDSRIEFPGYAVIEKREKPPRPPPPRKRRDKFATTPRPSPGPAPTRPQRAYSTLRPRSPTNFENDRSTPYVEIYDDDIDDNAEDIDNEHRDLMSGQIIMKMASRPLPAPPRPPRTKEKDKTIQEPIEDLGTYASSTQTDPLPDDMVIEEDIVQARVIITPSRSGSQILVSTERIPSPQQFEMQTMSREEITKMKRDILRGTSTRSEPELTIEKEEDISDTENDIPLVPPLPTSHLSSPPTTQEETHPQRPPRTRSQSLSVTRDDANGSRISAIQELEERLTALLTSETFKIANLEVGDLRVDKLSVSALEAHKIAVSELDAIVITASEITSTTDNNETEINPALLRELVAIRSQLESVAAVHHESSSESIIKKSETTKSDATATGLNIADVKNLPREFQKLDQLQLEPLSKTTESRALYSTQGSEQIVIREHHHYHQIQPEEVIKESTTSTSRPDSRSHSPVRITSTGVILSKETASPVKHLPPAISVTPDIVDNPITTETRSTAPKESESNEGKPQRATISYAAKTSPECPPSPIPQQFIAFPASQIPPQFFALSSSPVQTPATNSETNDPGVIDMTQQLLHALRLAGKRAMRHFVGYVVSRVSQEESEAKIREIELTLCALLLIIAGLLIVCFAGPRTITHHHHWDYFNPPRL